MTRRMFRAAALLAACACALTARPARAGGGAGTCTATVPAGCPAVFLTIPNFPDGLIPTQFADPRLAIDQSIRMVNDLADATFPGTTLSIFQSEFTRLCLIEDLKALRALTSPATGQVSAANLAEFCRRLALLRSQLTQRRTDGRINNCFIRLTCGFNAQGFLVRCNENIRCCLTALLDANLRCAAELAGCTNPAPVITCPTVPAPGG